MVLPCGRRRAWKPDLLRYAALHKERADDGGEHGDDELDDSLPSLQVFQEFHNVKSV